MCYFSATVASSPSCRLIFNYPICWKLGMIMGQGGSLMEQGRGVLKRGGEGQGGAGQNIFYKILNGKWQVIGQDFKLICHSELARAQSRHLLFRFKVNTFFTLIFVESLNFQSSFSPFLLCACYFGTN